MSTTPPATREPNSRPPGFFGSWLRDWATLRKPAPLWEAFLLGVACLALCALGWWLVTRGAVEERLVGPYTLPSPSETFTRLPGLFKEFALVENTRVTLRRVSLGFLLAIVVGVPLGILAGCFPRFNAFLTPLVIFGRNIPIAAVSVLVVFIAQGEWRKVLFIFIATVAFVISDSAQAIYEVGSRYVDTAYTLGASRWQTIMKVLVPLALPSMFSSFRVMFGLAFGYIMLAESIRDPDVAGGLGNQIFSFQRRGLREELYLVILIIPLVALGIDLVLFWIQKQLFPHVYGGSGWLQRLARVALHGWEDLKRVFFDYEPPKLSQAVPAPSATAAHSVEAQAEATAAAPTPAPAAPAEPPPATPTASLSSTNAPPSPPRSGE